MKLGLKNIKELMISLKNPQDNFKSIHIAGTNGKGSVCSLISSILEKQGYNVGVYTSPHLVDFRERIKINGKQISKKDLIKTFKKIKPFIRDQTFFEVVTAIAFTYFQEKKVDFAIIEVGLGGRLDATNIIIPIVSVITNISLEHTEHLGDTIEKIAFEKSGIIKENIPLVTSNDCKGISVIKKICKSKKSKIYFSTTKKIKTSLKGEFQNENASIGLKVIDVLSKNYKIKKKKIESGLMSAKWPGRFDFVSKNLIFDCAHNPKAALVLSKEIKNLNYDKIYLVLGIMKDKDIEGMCKSLESVADEIIICKPKIKRSAEPSDIKKFLNKKLIVIKNVGKALSYAKKKAGKNDLVLLTGSIFTVGEGFSNI